MVVLSGQSRAFRDGEVAPRASLKLRLFPSRTGKIIARQDKATPPTESTGLAGSYPVKNSENTNRTSTAGPSVGTPDGGLVSFQRASRSAQLPPATTTPAPNINFHHLQGETEKEKASVETALTAKGHRLPFYRRKGSNRSHTSEGALSSTSFSSMIKSRRDANEAGKNFPENRSFIAKVVQSLVPCFSPDPSTLVNQDEFPVSRTHTDIPKEIPEMQDVLSDAPIARFTRDQLAIDREGLPLVIPPKNTSQPPSPTDSEVIVPPPLRTHLLPEDETDGLTSGAVQPPGSIGSVPSEASRTQTHDTTLAGDESDITTYTDDDGEERHILADQDEEERLIKSGGSGIPIGPDGSPKPLLPPILPQHVGRKCLVLDLDETLVHSSFKAIQQADFIVPVEIEYHWHHFHVLKRPGVDTFLKRMGELYEIVVFTASLSKYADPVLDKLDTHKVVAHRLFRESCFSHRGNYVKDLSQLGRPVSDTIILDNSPASYIFHPNNAVPVSSWFNDPHDAELTDLIPFLADLTFVSDVRGILDGAR